MDTETDELDVCGDTYDHDLRLIDERDGMATYECRKCGGEIIDDVSPDT